MEEKQQQHILFIEDDVLMERVFERLFRLSGFKIEIITDGEDALTHFNTMTEKPDLILLDVMIPKISGLDLLASIKANPELKTIPVVVLSNVAENENAQRALKLGADLYLIKSENGPEEIVQKIRQVILAREQNQNQ